MVQTAPSRLNVSSFKAPDDTTLRYGIVTPKQDPAELKAALIYVPGLGGSVKNALQFLERMAPDIGPIYSLDSRGCGLNDSVAPKPTPGSAVKDLHVFIDHLMQNQIIAEDTPLVLMGLSLGAVLSTLYQTEYATRFAAHIMLAPAFRPHPKLFSTSYKIKTYKDLLIKGHRAQTIMPYGIAELTRNPDCYDDPNFQDPLILPTFYLFFVEQLCKKAYKQVGRLTLPSAVVAPGKDFICCPDAMEKVFSKMHNPQNILLRYEHLFHDVCMEPEEDLLQVTGDLKNWLFDILKSR